MTESTLITDYLGRGLASARPSSLTVAAGALALYYETDTATWAFWNGSGWTALPGGLSQLVAGAGLSGGTITATGTIALGTIAAGGFLVNAGTAAAVPGAGGFGGGLSLNAGGTLSAQWQAGTVTALGTAVADTGGTLTVAQQWQAGTATALSDLLSLAAGTLDVATALRSVPLAFSFSGKPAAGQMIHIALINDVPLDINSGLVGTATYVGTDPAATQDFILSKVNSGTVTAIGTIAISTAGSVTLSGSAYASASGDALRITAPGTQDATLADVCITIEGKRS